MATVDVGDRAPAFALPDQEGRIHRLKDYAGRPVVLYFYPKDDTPGCTREACDFRDAQPAFERLGAAVLGVSVLDTASKARFAAKHGVRFPLLADEDHAVAERYGAWKKKTLYGKTRMGIARTTVLIDPQGRVARRWDNVKVDGHVDAVLAAVKELVGGRG